MRTRLLILGLALALPTLLFAQTSTPASRIAWDQAAADLATAQALTYRYYPDGAATGTVFSGVTCSGTASPFTCSVAFPAFSPGPHSLTLSAANAAGESAKSAAVSFTFVVIPAVPANPRIVP